MKNIHRYAISLYPHQSHFKNKSKCGICSDVSLFCKKKERHGRSIVVCYFNSYIESNLTLSCVIKSKQNLLFESKCMFQTHSNTMDIKR